MSGPTDYVPAEARDLAYRPFPTGDLPAAAAAMVRAVAEAVRVDAAFAALPALAAMAGAVGNARRVVVKKGREEPAVLWLAVVAKSGTGKTPAAAPLLEPLRRRQASLLRDYNGDRKAFDGDLLAHDATLAAWKKTPDGPPPEPPEPPPCPRLLVDDATIEALAPILLDNPRGVLLAADELRAWLGTFDRYSKGGGDMARWLSMHGAGQVIVDRKTGNPRHLFVPAAAVSVTGGIQPGILRAALTGEHFAAGLGARLLLACPPPTPRRWSDAEVPERVASAWAGLLERLAALPMGVDAEGEPVPVRVPMAADARRAFAAWHDAHYEAADADAGDDLAAAMSKIESAACRIALLLALADDAAEVDASHVTRAGRLADWFAAEARRAYAMLAGDAGADPLAGLATLAETIRTRFGGEVSVRDWQNYRPRHVATADDARAELAALEAAGYGRVSPAAQQGRGRPSERFALQDAGDGDRNSRHGTPRALLSPSPRSGTSAGAEGHPTDDTGPTDDTDETPPDEPATGGFVGVGASPPSRNGTHPPAPDAAPGRPSERFALQDAGDGDRNSRHGTPRALLSPSPRSGTSAGADDSPAGADASDAPAGASNGQAADTAAADETLADDPAGGGSVGVGASAPSTNGTHPPALPAADPRPRVRGYI